MRDNRCALLWGESPRRLKAIGGVVDVERVGKLGSSAKWEMPLACRDDERRRSGWLQQGKRGSAGRCENELGRARRQIHPGEHSRQLVGEVCRASAELDVERRRAL